MSLFDKFKVVAQNSQNTQNPENGRRKNTFEDIENIEHILPTYKRVGLYESKEHLHKELKKYPRLVPCPKNDWHWQDKELCYKKCTNIPKNCIYHNVAFYRVTT